MTPQDAIGPAEDPQVLDMDRQDSPSSAKVVHNAKTATEKEQSMTLLQGIKLYPKAVGWSILISTCIAMEGYDISLVNNFYGFPQFRRKYGQQMPDGSYQVTAPVCEAIYPFRNMELPLTVSAAVAIRS